MLHSENIYHPHNKHKACVLFSHVQFVFEKCFEHTHIIFWKKFSHIFNLTSENSVTSIYILKDRYIWLLSKITAFSLFYYVSSSWKLLCRKWLLFSLHQLTGIRTMQKTPTILFTSTSWHKNHAEDNCYFLYTNFLAEEIILHNCYSLYIIFLA